MARPTVFVGSSSEGISIAKAVQFNLALYYDVELWTQGAFGLTKGPLESLVAEVSRFDFAVLVLTPDDMSVSRGEEAPAARDNVLFELGLFMGAIGRDRTFMVHDRTDPLRLPSDLAGVAVASFRPFDTKGGNLPAALGPPCTMIQNSIESLGVRPERIPMNSSSATEDTVQRNSHAGLRAQLAEMCPRLSLTSLAAGSFRNGHQELFVSFRDGRLFHTWDYGDGWSKWNSFDAPAAPFMDMCCSSSMSDAFELFAVDGKGSLHHRWYRRVNNEWSPWHLMHTPGPVAAVTSGSYTEGHQELFVTLRDGVLFNRWQYGGVGWSGWTWFNAPWPVRAIACTSREPGEFELFAITEDGRLRNRWYSQGGSWAEWAEIATPDSVVTLVAGGHRPGHKQLFIALGDGRIIHRWHSGNGWSRWHDFDAIEGVVALTCSNRTDYEQELFAIDTNGRLLRRWYNREKDDWVRWREMDTP